MRSLSELGLTESTAPKYVRENRCAECAGTLHISSGSYYGYDEAVIKCIRSKDHSEFGRPLKKETDNEARINKVRRLIELSEQGTDTKALQTLYHSAMTETRAMDIINAIWPTAPDIDRKKAAMLCASYGLNPLAKHVFLIPFKNKNGGQDWTMVMGIAATRVIAQRQGDFSYLDDTPRIMTKDEQFKAFGEVDASKIWAVCKLKNVITGATAIGRGNWPKDTQPQGTDKGNTKANMAFIRAERQALDRLCPGKLPTNVEVMDESLIDIPDVGQVDRATGQIIEASAKVLNPKPAPAQPQPSGAVSDTTKPCPHHDMRPMKKNKWGGYSHELECEKNSRGNQKYCNWNDLAVLEKAIKDAEKQALPPDAPQPPPEEEKATPPAQDGEIDGKPWTFEDMVLTANSKFGLGRKDIETILGTKDLEKIENFKEAYQKIHANQEPK